LSTGIDGASLRQPLVNLLQIGVMQKQYAVCGSELACGVCIACIAHDSRNFACSASSGGIYILNDIASDWASVPLAFQ